MPFPCFRRPTANPLPSPTTAAIAGSVTYQNTFITATPIATPAPPAAEYARGECTIYFEQYQKDEDGQNTTGEFQFIAILYDAKTKVLRDSGKIPAPGEKPVEVYGLIVTATLTAGNMSHYAFTVIY